MHLKIHTASRGFSLRIQYKAISVLLTSDVLRTVRTWSLQVPLIKIGLKQSERLSFQIMPLIFHFVLNVQSKAHQQVPAEFISKLKML